MKAPKKSHPNLATTSTARAVLRSLNDADECLRWAMVESQRSAGTERFGADISMLKSKLGETLRAVKGLFA